jgi:membrane glycosyltransferase
MSAPELLAPPLEREMPFGRPATPAGIQTVSELARRRLFFAAFNLIVYAALLWAAAEVFGAGGWTAMGVIGFAAFAIASPWTVLGFANAAVGSWLLHLAGDGMAKAAPYARAGDEGGPLTVRTAIAMTVRNEEPARAILRLRILKESLDRTGEGDRFDYYILSDSDQAHVIFAEEAAVADWKRSMPQGESNRAIYRRRTENSGFKAGNVRDFCERWGGAYHLLLTLDADSLMSGETVLRLVRIMEAYPKIGILQSLITGMPSSSAFARIFQFGMRHGMRPYTMGQAWWTGDCGPYWGHNALVRMKPFIEHCQLPKLNGRPPLGGHILSHDQIEAAFMRRAGYEVRVLPEECGSWDENPPTVIEFMKRDIRWCQGNLQYAKLLAEPGLHAVSRFQLVWAILMFVSIPAWPLLIALLPFLALSANNIEGYSPALAAALYTIFLLMHLSPKLAGFAEVLTRQKAKRYGGMARVIAGAAIETAFSFLLGAISTVRITLFIFSLLTGVSVRWNGQLRDAHEVSWKAAFLLMWPQLAAGLAISGLLLAISPVLFAASLPLTAGYLLAVPFAVLTASPMLGRLFERANLCGIPEDFCPPLEIEKVRWMYGKRC